MFDDYVLYLLESLHCQERANDLMRSMKGDGSTGETDCKTGPECFTGLLQFSGLSSLEVKNVLLYTYHSTDFISCI